jgi:hypothetical protein
VRACICVRARATHKRMCISLDPDRAAAERCSGYVEKSSCFPEKNQDNLQKKKTGKQQQRGALVALGEKSNRIFQIKENLESSCREVLAAFALDHLRS